MCGRMTLTRSGSEIAAYFEEAMAMGEGTELPVFELREPNGEPLRKRFNVAPSGDVLTLVPGLVGSGETAAFSWKRWGLVPKWAKDPSIGSKMFNARAETVDTKPSFRAAWKRRRCLVAADGFYEWTPRNRGHRPYYFQSTRGDLLAFAGLFEEWHRGGGEGIESCTVLTTDANADLAEVHHRMPVIVDAANYSRWLDLETEPESLKTIVVPAPAGTLERREVTRFVNDPRRDDERCIAAVPRAEQADLFSLEGTDAFESFDEEF